MIWWLQWSGTCNDIVNTLQPTCHHLSSANERPALSVINQSEVRWQKPAVTCEEESFQGCNAATNPTLHIFLLTFSHFMPFYVLSSVLAPNTWPLHSEIQHRVHRGDWFVTPHPAKCTLLISTEYAHFIWILINISPPSWHVLFWISECNNIISELSAVSIFAELRLGLWLHHSLSAQCNCESRLVSPLSAGITTPLTWWR